MEGRRDRAAERYLDGRAIAAAYASEGAVVYLAGRSRSDLDAAVAQIAETGGHGVALELDVTDEDSISSAFARIGGDGALDIAVLNAGIFPDPAPVETSTSQQWRSTFDANLFGVIDTARAAIPLLRNRGGKIIVVGSGTGHQTNPRLPPLLLASPRPRRRRARPTAGSRTGPTRR